MSKWGGRRVAQIKWQVAATHGTTCYVCRGPIDMTRTYPDPLSASVEHVVPRSLGGGDDIDGLRLSHLHCNISRGARPVKTARPPVRSGLVAGLF